MFMVTAELSSIKSTFTLSSEVSWCLQATWLWHRGAEKMSGIAWNIKYKSTLIYCTPYVISSWSSSAAGHCEDCSAFTMEENIVFNSPIDRGTSLQPTSCSSTGTTIPVTQQKQTILPSDKTEIQQQWIPPDTLARNVQQLSVNIVENIQLETNLSDNHKIYLELSPLKFANIL